MTLETVALTTTQTLFAPLTLTACILAAAVLVIVPLGRDVLAKLQPPRRAERKWITFIAASLAAIAVAMPPSWQAGLFAVPWTLLTATFATAAALDWRKSNQCQAGAFACVAANTFLAIGGAWLILTAAGLDLFGFGEPITRLTAIHFHYAGFVLTTIAARVQQAFPGRVVNVTVAAILCGIPLVAAGITLRSSAFELAATLFLAMAAATLAVLQVIIAIRSQQGRPSNRKATSLLTISSASLCTAMVLAVGYALGRFQAVPVLDIPTMIATHGVLNAAGCCLLGLLGWRDLDRGNKRS